MHGHLESAQLRSSLQAMQQAVRMIWGRRHRRSCEKALNLRNKIKDNISFGDKACTYEGKHKQAFVKWNATHRIL